MNKEQIIIEKNSLAMRGDSFFTEKAMTVDREQILMMMRESIDYVIGPRVLEMGYTNRGWTDALLNKGYDLVVIEGSKVNVDYARSKYAGKLDIKHMLFEEFDAFEEFDTIVMSCVLEHVMNPVDILKKAKTWMKRDGRIIINVPNKMSLHRRIGYSLGMIKSYDELSKNDLEVGHRHQYDVDLMMMHLKKADLCARFEKGIFLKPLSSDQMKEWPNKLLWAFNDFGRLLPEWSAFLLFTAWK